jgi:hypothetical protein
MNAQPRRALDAWPWPLKKPLYPVIIRKGAVGKGAEATPGLRAGRNNSGIRPLPLNDNSSPYT